MPTTDLSTWTNDDLYSYADWLISQAELDPDGTVLTGPAWRYSRTELARITQEFLRREMVEKWIASQHPRGD